MPVPLALLLAPAVIQGVTGASQLVRARKMQKELGDRVNYEIPEEAKKAYALAQGLASSREMPGQASMQAMMDYQAQKALGTFSRGASGSTDMAALSADIAERQFESQLGLGVQAAQNYQQRQQALYGAMQNMAGYQDKVTADRQQDWYERAEAAAQMKEGGLQNLMGTAQSLGQMGMMGMMYGGGGAGTGTGSIADSFTKSSDLPSSIDFSPMSGKNLMKTMMQNRQAAPTASSFATRATQGTYSPSFGFGNRMGKNPSMWDETFPGLYSGLGEFSKPDLSRITGGYGNNNFNSGFFGADLFNPIY
jgi:hypothetical protein